MKKMTRDVQSSRSIRRLAILHIVMMTVMSAGVLLNFHLIVTICQSQEQLNFVNLAESLAMTITRDLSTVTSGAPLGDEAINRLKTAMRIMRMNVQDRLYIVTRQGCYRIFPERAGPSGMMDPVRTVSHWQAAWKGIRVQTPQYLAYDQKPVIALVLPQPAITIAPDFLIVIERLADASIRRDRFAYAIQAFTLMSFIFSVILILYQTSLTLRAFNRLNQAISPLGTVAERDSRAVHRDIIERCIEIVETAARTLSEKHSRLDEMTSSLAARSGEAGEDIGQVVLSSIGIGLITFDRDRMIVSATQPARIMLNLDTTDPIGKPCEAVFGGSGLITTMLTDALKDKRVHRFRSMKVELPGKDPGWVSLSSILLRSHSGVLIGAAFSIMDVSDTKRLEARAREQEHLAALGELSAGIAHEFRNPLGVINGNADLLMDEVNDSDSQQIVRAIKDEVTGLNRIITDFLSFARPVPLGVQYVDPVQLCRESIAEFLPVAGELIEFDIESCPGVPSIEIDEALIRQVLSIVITNSIQAIEEKGTIKLKISVRSDAGVGDAIKTDVLIEIADTGCGVNPDRLPHLFKPFFTTKPKGTGLGLAIARKIVSLHHGRIEFAPDSPPCARVIISLPVEYDPDRTISSQKI